MTSENQTLIDDDEKSGPSKSCGLCFGFFLFAAGLAVSVYGFTNSSHNVVYIVGIMIGIIGLLIIITCCSTSCCCSTERINTDLQPNQFLVDGHVGTFSDPENVSPIFHINQTTPVLNELNQHYPNYTMSYPQNLFPTCNLTKQVFNVPQHAAPFYQVQPSAPFYQVQTSAPFYQVQPSAPFYQVQTSALFYEAQNYSLDLPPPYSA